MSLKVFHLVFVSFSIGVSLFTGAWGVWVSRFDQDPRYLVLTFIGFPGALGLFYYGIRTYSKLFRSGGDHV